MIGAICFIINDRLRAKIYQLGTFELIDWAQGRVSPLGPEFIVYDRNKELKKKASIIIAKGVDEKPILRLIETKQYILKVEGDVEFKIPRLQNAGNKFLNCSEDKDYVIFQYINFIGKSKIIFDNNGYEKILRFEVIPDKISYEEDYIKLTESLAEFCSELLLDYSGSTSNTFSQQAEDQKTLLEQFIFLRQFCYSQNIRSIFESIKRNPDRKLKGDEEFKPLGIGIPSKKFFTNPFSNSREWTKINSDGYSSFLPQMISVQHKYDSLDTAANRFIKMALQKFDSLCIELEKRVSVKGCTSQFECIKEAQVIHNEIEEILLDDFFKEVNTLDTMPQNSQVLQKRDGYAQIFSAFSMIDLALKLDWKGKDDIYEGESKNVALLYEYWLFFELYRIIKSIDNCNAICSDNDAFLDFSNGVTISLKQGKKACQSFEISNIGIKINLYYNRTFKISEFRSTQYEGSYSRPFRPDYTIAIFPIIYKRESEAIKDGAVSYVHFDAKYRISDLTSIVGYEQDKLDEDELIADKIDSIINTYKRGDLMKMHTYNNAIRRTVGSYVLYPGSYSKQKEGNKTFRLYDEILPGVGAFSIKPSNNKEGENALRDFIIAIINSRVSTDSRLNRVNYFSDIVFKEPPAGKETNKKKNEASMETVVIGYIRGHHEGSYHSFLEEKVKTEPQFKFIFYFYAIKGNYVYSHHKDVFSSKYFMFYTNDIDSTKSYILEPIWCKVLANKLVSRSELVDQLTGMGFKTQESDHGADFYYVLEVQVEDILSRTFPLTVKEVNTQNGNDTFSPHSPKVIPNPFQ